MQKEERGWCTNFDKEGKKAISSEFKVEIVCPKCGGKCVAESKVGFIINNQRYDEYKWLEKMNCMGCGQWFYFKFVRGSVGWDPYYKIQIRPITKEEAYGRTSEESKQDRPNEATS